MSLVKKLLLPLFSIFVLVLLFINRTVPSGVLWNGYSLLYVPVSTPENIVLQTFEKNEIAEVVCLSNQYLPVAVNKNSPEASMLFLSSSSNTKGQNDYIQNRKNYFFDKNKEYKIYYVDSKYKNRLKDCVSDLEHQKITAGIDSKAVYPWILPVLCCVLMAVLLIFEKNKLLFCGTALFPIMYIFTNPFYPSAVAVTLTLLVAFCGMNIWKRKGALTLLKSNYILLSLALIAFAAAFASSILSGLYFILTVFAMAAYVFFYDDMEEFFLNKKFIRFAYIRPAGRISIFAEKARFILTTMLAIQVLVLIAFFASSTQVVSSKFTKLLLPSSNPLSYEVDESLPKLEEYYRWNYIVQAYPYISLNKEFDETTNDIVYPRYVENNGKIERVENHLTYNDEFKKSVNKNIDNLQYNSIESILKNQKSDFEPGFSAAKSNPINLFGIIIMIVSILLLLFIYFSVIMKRTKAGGKK